MLGRVLMLGGITGEARKKLAITTISSFFPTAGHPQQHDPPVHRVGQPQCGAAHHIQRSHSPGWEGGPPDLLQSPGHFGTHSLCPGTDCACTNHAHCGCNGQADTSREVFVDSTHFLCRGRGGSPKAIHMPVLPMHQDVPEELAPEGAHQNTHR